MVKRSKQAVDRYNERTLFDDVPCLGGLEAFELQR